MKPDLSLSIRSRRTGYPALHARGNRHSERETRNATRGNEKGDRPRGVFPVFPQTLAPFGLSFLLLALAAPLPVSAQEPVKPQPKAPEQEPAKPGPAAGGETRATEQAAEEGNRLREELQALAEKANGGDTKAALELADRVLAAGDLNSASLLYQQAAQGDEVEAQEKLALLLLNNNNPALWPTGHSWLDKAVQKESVGAMEAQAEILLNGSHGREQSVHEAVKLLNRARQLPGATRAHFMLGNLAAQGIGMPKDAAIAIAHFREGMDAGFIPCMLGLHRLYREGQLVEKDLAEAERIGLRASEKGDPTAAYEMAIFIEQFRQETPDWEGAAPWLQLASERGHGGASTRLASYYMNGKMGDPDPEKAVSLCRLAAEQGDAEACLMLGGFYQEGKVVPQDLVASTAWVRLAAERRNPLGQNEYGMRLVGGLGANRNPSEAAQWFLQAANAGMPAAMVNLGELLQHGVGVQREPAQAKALYERAATAGHAGAHQRVALMLARGEVTGGVPDPVGAAYWAEKALAIDPTAEPLAKELKEKLNADQKGELDRRLKAAGVEAKPAAPAEAKPATPAEAKPAAPAEAKPAAPAEAKPAAAKAKPAATPAANP